MTSTSTSTSTEKWIPVGEGFPYIPSSERTGERFGAIALTTIQGQGLGPAVQFGQVPVDQHGWLVAVPLDGSPTTATIVLGQGTLFTNDEPGYPVIGLVPDDDRTDRWLDPAGLYQVDEQRIRLLFVPDEGGE